MLGAVQQSLTKVTQAARRYQRSQTLRRLLYYSLGALVVVGVMSAWLGWIVAFGAAARARHHAAARTASE